MSIQTRLQAGTATSEEVLVAAGAIHKSEDHRFRYDPRIELPNGNRLKKQTFTITSLDDAVDLFKARLPGWRATISTNGHAECYPPDVEVMFSGLAKGRPATALLIAMFNAMGVE